MRKRPAPPRMKDRSERPQEVIKRSRKERGAEEKITIFSEKVTDSASTAATTVRNCLVRSLVSTYSKAKKDSAYFAWLGDVSAVPSSILPGLLKRSVLRRSGG